ncbi:hypothetical protein ACVBGC_26265 [Burkholderia stagnalis]
MTASDIPFENIEPLSAVSVCFAGRAVVSARAPLRAGDNQALLDVFRKAVDYGLERLPDYGQPHGPLDRGVASLPTVRSIGNRESEARTASRRGGRRPDIRSVHAIGYRLERILPPDERR